MSSWRCVLRRCSALAPFAGKVASTTLSDRRATRALTPRRAVSLSSTAAAALALVLSCVASAAAETSPSPPPPSPPFSLLGGMSECNTEACHLRSAVFALSAVLAFSGVANVVLAVYVGWKARMCRSWCDRCVAKAMLRVLTRPTARSGKSARHYAARQAPCPLRCARCRRQWDVRFRWAWHECRWVTTTDTGPVLARPSVSVFGFPVASSSDNAPFHLTAVVSSLDGDAASAAPELAMARLEGAGQGRSVAVVIDDAPPPLETGDLDFYGQETAHSTHDFFRPTAAGGAVNPLYRAFQA